MIPASARPSEFFDLVGRFFSALDELRSRRLIRGKKTFCDRYGINRWNMNELQRDNTRTGLFHAEWLTFLARDYGVSADWLLTGSGEPLPKKKTANMLQKGKRKEKSI